MRPNKALKPTGRAFGASGGLALRRADNGHLSRVDARK
jgi:hypothetical protein